MLLTSSAIIEDILPMCRSKSADPRANLAFFYFDHLDVAKLNARSLLSSLLVQLSNQSDRFLKVLSALYLEHDHGSRQPGEDKLVECLQKMISQGTLTLPVYIIVDGLDECPDFSGLVSPPAKKVLEIIQGLIKISPPVHLCITSRRPDRDTRRILKSSSSVTNHTLYLDKQDGQHEDIAKYIKFVVRSDSRIEEWPEEDKKLVVKRLEKDCSGMYAAMFVIFCGIF